MRALACFLFCVACGGTLETVDGGPLTDGGALPDGAPTDGNAVKDAVPDAPLPPFDAGTFCSGSNPRMMINGAEVSVLKASGKALALNCCDSAELTLATSAYQALFNVLWRAQAPASYAHDGAALLLDRTELAACHDSAMSDDARDVAGREQRGFHLAQRTSDHVLDPNLHAAQYPLRVC